VKNFATPALRAALYASLLTVVMGVAIGFSKKLESGLDSSVVSLWRVLMNGVWVASLIVLSRELRVELFARRPDRNILLWGLFGALTVHSYTFAVVKLGMGMATLLLQTFQVLGIALLGPLLTGSRWTRSLLFSLLSCLVGLMLLKGREWTGWEPALYWGVFAGIAAALAYLMLARTSGRFSSGYAMFYWTLFCLASHLMHFSSVGTPILPHQRVLVMLVVAGLLAAAAQFLTTRAYQDGPAVRVTLVLYLAPILGMSLDAYVFGKNFGLSQALGTGLVIVTGFVQMRARDEAGHGSGARSELRNRDMSPSSKPGAS
jgi:drug/metabolite transporter (DMT)-like permease